MTRILAVDDAYADQVASLQAIGRQTVPARAMTAAELAPTWAQVLVAGAVTGGTSPTIDAGDSLAFDTSWTISRTATGLTLTRVGVGDVLVLLSTDLRVQVPLLQFYSVGLPVEITQDGTGGLPMNVQAQDGDGTNGGTLTVQGGDGLSNGDNGGNMIVEGGDATAAVGTGGTAYLRGGLATAGAASYGEALIQHADYNVAIRVQNGTGHTGGQAILIDQTGLAFFDGTTVTKPSIVGAKGGNVALTNLLTALANMGLIIDNTT